jgi:flavoprotein
MLQEENKERENQNKILPSDYYLENGRVVFTQYYHMRRGSCCGSGKGCRHCPYDPVGVKGNTVLSKKTE